MRSQFCDQLHAVNIKVHRNRRVNFAKMAFSQSYQQELIELAEIAGISAAPGVFRIILDLLALQVSPEDIYILLKEISMKSPSSSQNQSRTNESAYTFPSTKK